MRNYVTFAADRSAFMKGDNYFKMHRFLISELGDFVAAGFMNLLIDIDCSPTALEYSNRNGGYFYATIERIEEELALSSHLQQKAIELLEMKGLIATKRMGTPAKRHFLINYAALAEMGNAYQDKQQKKQEEQSVKKVEKTNYYEELTSSIWEGFDSFKQTVGNMRQEQALAVYVFTRLVHKYSGARVEWDSQTYGKFRAIIGNKEIDYKRLDLACQKYKEGTDPRFVVAQFKSCYYSEPENAPASRFASPVQLACWEELKGEVA